MFGFLRKRFGQKPLHVTLGQGKSFHVPELDLIVSSGGVWYVPNPKGEQYRKIKPDAVELVIGALGLPNVKKELQLGDAVLYQTPNFGVVEVRVVEIGPPTKIMISVVTPRSGFSVAYENESLANAPFSTDEIAKIAGCVDNVARQMASRSDITPEQLAFLSSKLQEIADASKRLGRKDWIMFVAGTLTNVVVGAAFSPEATKALFTALNKELSWVFQNALRLVAS